MFLMWTEKDKIALFCGIYAGKSQVKKREMENSFFKIFNFKKRYTLCFLSEFVLSLLDNCV